MGAIPGQVPYHGRGCGASERVTNKAARIKFNRAGIPQKEICIRLSKANNTDAKSRLDFGARGLA